MLRTLDVFILFSHLQNIPRCSLIWLSLLCILRKIWTEMRDFPNSREKGYSASNSMQDNVKKDIELHLSHFFIFHMMTVCCLYSIKNARWLHYKYGVNAKWKISKINIIIIRIILKGKNILFVLYLHPTTLFYCPKNDFNKTLCLWKQKCEFV